MFLTIFWVQLGRLHWEFSFDVDMRGSLGHLSFKSLGRYPPSNWLLLCIIAILAFTALLGSSRLSSLIPSTPASPSFDVYGNYRRLREQAVAELTEIRSLSQGTHGQEFELCNKELENYVPCYNVTANQLAGFHDGEEFDRHCEISGVGPHCLIRPSKDYKIPLRWPAGRDVIWSGNVKITKDQFLSSGSMTKRLMLLEENQIAFHSDDGTISDGVKDYSRQIAEMIGLTSDSEFHMAGIHTLLDIGCGFGSFGAHLFSVKLTTVCVAVYEVFGSQVQLALERGLPAIIGNFISRQLPYPSLSFDLVHCAQCGISWHEKDGMYLIEADRVLKPGGYFVLTLPLTKSQGSTSRVKNQNMVTYIEEFVDKICWSLLSQQDETFVWQKTTDAHCYAFRKQGDIPPLCKEESDVDSYYQPLASCISGTNSERWIPIQNRSHVQPSTNAIAIHGKYCFNCLCYGLVMYKGESRVKAVNSEARPIYAVVRDAVVKIEGWSGRANFSVVQTDDFQIILGMEFLCAAKMVPMPHLRSVSIMDERHPCMVPAVPTRKDKGIQQTEFDEDSKTWRSAVTDYWSLLTPLIFSDHPKRPGDEDPLPPFNMIRNVMDMNARYGGFNHALLEEGKSVWVMNVVPVRTHNTLPLIIDRGFAGILHDWCEPFPTYPRTYDMIHATDLLSHHLHSEGCDLSALLLEMDRMLRPEGWVVFRDQIELIEKARIIATQIRWDARVIELQSNNDKRKQMIDNNLVGHR
ncbi:putative methyltransferase [Nymphaea thermarum]|nr:putative methyltransferase [Nymphaea thermarum]